MSHHAFRLTPGEDLRAALCERAAALGLGAAAVVTCVGSLSAARLRLADASQVVTVDGPLEIVSCVGTLGPDGPHLHVAVADRAGRVTGGHLQDGSPVHTTAEVVLLGVEGVQFKRQTDTGTGFAELVVVPLDSSKGRRS